MLEPETADAGVGSGLALDNSNGFQEGVGKVGMGVWDEGSQAGVVDEDQSGMGVALPELEWAGRCGIWVSV
jgi:hypothetical protein